jgi:hypothetical protein
MEGSFGSVMAVPVSKKLPWMDVSTVPPEFFEDIQKQRKPN